MALKIIQSMKPEVSIKHLIHKALAGSEEPRGVSTIHASDLFKSKEFCPRERAFQDLGIVKPKSEFVGTALRITFQHGKDMENRFRNDWLPHLLVGFWKCGVCGKKHPTFGRAPKSSCSTCGWNRWEYEEVRVFDEESGVSGGVDALLDVGEAKLLPVELKSMDKDEHRKLAGPLSEHRIRTGLYLYLIEKCGENWTKRINTKTSKILYVSKSYGFKDTSLSDAGISDSPFSPFKEFSVGRDDKNILVPLQRAKALTKWRKLGEQSPATGLPCGICHNGLTKRAQQCSAVGPCFSGSYPSTLTWTENGVVKHLGKPIVVE